MRVGVYVDAMRLHDAASHMSSEYGFKLAKPDYEAIIVECLRVAALFAPGEELDLVRQAIYVASNGAAAFERALSKIGYEVAHHAFRNDGHCPECRRPRDRWQWDCQIATDVARDGFCSRIDIAIIASGSATLAPLFSLLDDLEIVGVAVGYGRTMSDRLPRRYTLPPRTLYEGAK